MLVNNGSSLWCNKVAISKTGDSTKIRSHRSRNRRTTWVLYNNYTCNWTGFSHPGVLTLWIYTGMCKELYLLIVKIHTSMPDKDL